MHDRPLLISAVLLIALGLAGLSLLGAGVIPPYPSTNNAVTDGQTIFRTGEDTNAQPIPFMGGMPMLMGCRCHAADGHGQRTPMFVSPNISYANLTDPAGMREPDGKPRAALHGRAHPARRHPGHRCRWQATRVADVPLAAH